MTIFKKKSEPAPFEYNLTLTKSYCDSIIVSSQKSKAEILRTIQIKHNNINLYSFKTENLYNNGKTIVTEWTLNPLNHPEYNNIEMLFHKQLENKKKINLRNSNNKSLGEILITNYGDVLNEGFCEDVSNGFIDEYDLPPFDTWFHLDTQNEKLYSWIPERFVKLIDEVIPCSSTDIYEWEE